jgi:hypothetical protein
MTTHTRLVRGAVLALAGLLALVVGASVGPERRHLTTCGPPTRLARPAARDHAPGAWVYYNMLEPLLTLDEKMRPLARRLLRGAVADQGPLQAAPG